MANASDDLEEKQKMYIARQQEISSSGPSSGDDENEDMDEVQNLSVAQQNINYNQNFNATKKSKKRAVELLESYRDTNAVISKPKNHEGILLKRRNWPMKGWHKRYFILADGILTYGKSKTDLTKHKDKPHGVLNAYMSIVSYISSKRRILIDSSTNSSAVVCQLKAKTQSEFETWLELLRQHRLYYQFKLFQNNNRNSSFLINNPTQLTPSNNRKSDLSSSNMKIQNSSNLINFPKNQTSEDLARRNLQINLKIDHEVKNKQKNYSVIDDYQLDNSFKQVEENLMNLSKVLGSLYLCTLSSSSANTINSSNNQISNLSGQASAFIPHHQAHQSSVSADFIQMMNANPKIHSSKSNPNLINNESALLTTNSNGNILSSLNSSPSTVSNLAMVLTVPPSISINSTGTICSSQTNQSSNSISNEENLFRKNFYQDAKSIHDQMIFIYQQLLLKKQNLLTDNSNMNKSSFRSQRSESVMSTVSLQDSQQFYDAIEYLTSESESDDDSDQESDQEAAEIVKSGQHPIVPVDLNRDVSYDPSEEELQTQKMMTRRRKLPATAPDASNVSVWGILRKAIGKDLSKISLPVILNEPLSILQRLSEELEYSDLLDTASGLSDPYDRMIYIAAFVISGYSSSYYRNGAKNFNPVLGETYELIRPDKGWKYVAEQVSHHPPISSCNCQSKNFIHEQVFHAKIKFWGKSMEVHPEGYTRVTLPKFNETYQWNKIVMYVHNVMGASRKIEQYGEITIRCTNGISCTINFPKSSNSSQKNEFYGEVFEDNVVKRKIFGQWHESFLCGMDNTAKTIWRMGAMPEDFNMYYGFTRFAMELNEITDDIKSDLPPTDTRFRPDQRNLENGDVERAECEKHRIEEKQRTRRKEMEAKGEFHQPLWFRLSKDSLKTSTNEEKEWIFNEQYWTKRENQGFKSMKQIFPNLW